MAFAALFGEKLLGKGGLVATEEVLSGKTAVALYFSAHWCPPCRGFTPQLAGWYNKDLQAKGLEVVFVSSDKDEEAFNEYYGEQPWLALPFAERDTKAVLSKKFKVQGIPTVVILGPDGKVLTTDGQSAISKDPTGEDLPWKAKTFGDVLSAFYEADLISPEGPCKGSSLKGKVFAFYFSAHWCPPCRGFTPQLAEWYKSSLKAKGLEVVFVSSDKSDEEFKSYFAEMPWLALDYSDRKLKETLSDCLGVSGIPALIIVGADGSVITKEGRGAISSDIEGVEFPWYPKPVSNLKAGPGKINEVPMLLAFCEGCDAATQKGIEEAMTPLAKKYLEEAKANDAEDPELAFTIVTEAEDLAGRLRQMLSIGETSVEPKLMLVDIPDDGGFYEGPAGALTEGVVEKFASDYAAKSLARKQLS